MSDLEHASTSRLIVSVEKKKKTLDILIRSFSLITSTSGFSAADSPVNSLLRGKCCSPGGDPPLMKTSFQVKR